MTFTCKRHCTIIKCHQRPLPQVIEDTVEPSLPVWDVNLKACTLDNLTHRLLARPGTECRLMSSVCKISTNCLTPVGQVSLAVTNTVNRFSCIAGSLSAQRLATIDLVYKYSIIWLWTRHWCCLAGKVTVGQESHWPFVTDLVVCPPTGQCDFRFDLVLVIVSEIFFSFSFTFWDFLVLVSF